MTDDECNDMTVRRMRAVRKVRLEESGEHTLKLMTCDVHIKGTIVNTVAFVAPACTPRQLLAEQLSSLPLPHKAVRIVNEYLCSRPLGFFNVDCALPDFVGLSMFVIETY